MTRFAPHWTPLEVELLRMLYPSGGAAAVLQTLTYRSTGAINANARSLRIKRLKIANQPLIDVRLKPANKVSPVKLSVPRK